MPSTEDSIFVVIVIAEVIIGLLANGYIALTSWRHWTKKKKISSINYILLSLAISRIGLLFFIALGSILGVLKPDFSEKDQVQLFISIFWTLINHLSMWFATCLNFFYLLKIANFSHPLFVWLKFRIDRVILWILLGCLTISSLTSLILAMVPNNDNKIYTFAKQRRNFTEMSHVSINEYLNAVSLFNLFIIVPFSVSLVSFFLLTMSLWRHTKQMKLSATDRRAPHTEAHVGAIKNVASFFFLLFVYRGACFLVRFSYLMKESKLGMMFGEATSVLFPSGHSLILIIGNNKLKQSLAKRLRCLKIACMM